MKWFSILCSLVIVPTVLAQPKISLEDFDAYVQKGVEDWEAPGLAVAIVKDGRVVFAKGYGVREIGKPDPVDEHTLFAIGSTTKAMTAAAIGMLVDEGKIDWDDPVTDHLPGFQLADPFVTREVTIRDLLTHRAGLPNADFLWYGRDHSPEDIIYRMRYVPQETSMRSSFTYQNVMYATAGAVIAEVSGTSWDDFVRERIFTPLGMTGAIATAATLDEQPNVASPHYRVEGVVSVIDNASVDAVAAAGSVWAGVADMAKWMRFLLEGGVTEDGTRLLSEKTYDELFTPQTLVDPDEFYPTQELTDPHWMTYGLGWFQHDYDGRAVDFHTGSIDGMVAIHGLIRDERLGVYVLGNLDHVELRHALMYRVFDLYGDGPGRDWSSELKALYDGRREEAESRRAEQEAKRVSGTSPTLPLARYPGTYSDRLYGTATVSGEAPMRLKLGPGLQGELEHWHYDVFRVRWDAAWRGSSLVTFRMNPDGEMDTLVIGGATFSRESSE